MTSLTRERRATLEWAIEAAVEKGYTSDADVIRDLLSELLSASKPAETMGWKLVPVEPTVEMLNAALEHDSTFGHGFKRRIYQEMLAVSPAAPAQSDEPVAWLVEWEKQFSDETWVHAHATEPTARDQARANGGTCTPLYATPRPSQTAVVLDDERECVNLCCNWHGPISNTVMPSDEDFPDILCPLCHAETTAVKAPVDAGHIEHAVGEIRIDAKQHPYAVLTTAYDENGKGWGAGTKLFTRSSSPKSAVVLDDERAAFERALFELVNKIDTGLDTGDLLKDARRASAALDSILSHGDLVACAHEYFRDSGERYEKSMEFRIGWNACLDAIANARAATPQPVAQPVEKIVDVSDLFADRATVIRVFDFYKKHAIGSLAAPSCLCCGRSTQDVEVAIKHMELPDIVVCAECHRAIAQPVEQTRALTDGQIEDLQEAREILENMVRSVELDGNYSTEATCTFLRQALQCLPAASPASGETE